jgi:hypothetical protein
MKSLLSTLALASLALGAQAQTKMYKCTGEGRTVYQQTACASAASASSAASAVAGAKAAGTAAPARTERARRASDADSAKPASADMAGRIGTARP